MAKKMQPSEIRGRFGINRKSYDPEKNTGKINYGYLYFNFGNEIGDRVRKLGERFKIILSGNGRTLAFIPDPKGWKFVNAKGNSNIIQISNLKSAHIKEPSNDMDKLYHMVNVENQINFDDGFFTIKLTDHDMKIIRKQTNAPYDQTGLPSKLREIVGSVDGRAKSLVDRPTQTAIKTYIVENININGKSPITELFVKYKDRDVAIREASRQLANQYHHYSPKFKMKKHVTSRDVFDIKKAVLDLAQRWIGSNTYAIHKDYDHATKPEVIKGICVGVSFSANPGVSPNGDMSFKVDNKHLGKKNEYLNFYFHIRILDTHTGKSTTVRHCNLNQSTYEVAVD